MVGQTSETTVTRRSRLPGYPLGLDARSEHALTDSNVLTQLGDSMNITLRTVLVLCIVAGATAIAATAAAGSPRTVTHKVPKSINNCGSFSCGGTSWTAAARSDSDACYYTHQHFD